MRRLVVVLQAAVVRDIQSDDFLERFGAQFTFATQPNEKWQNGEEHPSRDEDHDRELTPRQIARVGGPLRYPVQQSRIFVRPVRFFHQVWFR